MAYSELLKDFNKIRDYMREFYVYGFKGRDEFKKKSARAYDDERRRIDSWLNDYMFFRQENDGRKVFMSIDSRITSHNPLYRAWKTKSFTDKEITLHFILFDILCDEEKKHTLKEILSELDEYLSVFNEPINFDESTVRKKLKEYINEGIVREEKIGKTSYYSRTEDIPLIDINVLDFYSEVAPLGVVGSYILDKTEVIRTRKELFAFKHHYITSAMDSEILYQILIAMSERRIITVSNISRVGDKETSVRVVPLRIYVSVQNGRQYVMSFDLISGTIRPLRIDNIISLEINDIDQEFDSHREELNKIKDHIWGVSTNLSGDLKYEHVEFVLAYDKDEEFILSRLMREKRCGTVSNVGEGLVKFEADVFDSLEMVPWIRTFISRIVDIKMSNKELEEEFHKNLNLMYEMYEIDGA